MIEKKLGKIEKVHFGLTGYQDAMLGLSLTFSGDGWGVGTNEPMFWDANTIQHDKYSKWSEEDRDKAYAKTMRRISDLLKDAKVNEIHRLLGKPVECTFDGLSLVEWRILTEVL